ncbi:hypothetical protein [Nocardia tengchongensis]|uniref:hypothetical protein n=1 Tax=Nocardia tengchongensis TaxID=2055889 RepID=UPI00366875AD
MPSGQPHVSHMVLNLLDTWNADTDDTDGNASPADLEVVGPWGVRVMESRCTTCIFTAGNPMNLREGRLKQLLGEAIRNEGHIVCHDTLPAAGTGLDPAICRGFADHPSAMRSIALRLAYAQGVVPIPHPPPARVDETPR